jgi:naphthoate synthase/2-ketocyclohexanecarboxyl-CoA hydrolase
MSEWGDWRPVEGFDLEHVRYEKRHRTRGGGVARIRLDRPERMNALTGEMFQALVDTLRDANADSSIGAIVLSHTGPHFGVGGDLRGGLRPDLGGAMAQVDPTIKRCFKPVIAAVRGYVIGAHNHMAYTCDFTIAGESAVFGQNGPRVGSPATGYMVANSAHIMGMKRGRELWLRCRQLTAQEALEAGLCNTVVQDGRVDAEVEQWCDELLDLVPTCVAAGKQSFEAIDAPLQYSTNFLNMIEPDFFGQPEIREAIQAFLERRKPNFWQEEMVARRKF